MRGPTGDRRAIAMGRTNPTYRDALRAIEERWAEFRRALRRRDQPALTGCSSTPANTPTRAGC